MPRNPEYPGWMPAQERPELLEVIEDMPPMVERGTTGLKHSLGYVLDEWHPKLQGRDAVRIYREMSDNDAVCGSALKGMKAFILATPWSINPRIEGDPEAERQAAYIRTCLGDMSMTVQEFLSDVLSMLEFGYSYHSIVAKVRRGEDGPPELRSEFNDGGYGWRKLPIRAQDTIEQWMLEDDGSLNGCWQVAAPLYKREALYLKDSLLFRTTNNKSNPEGRALPLDTPIPTPDGWTTMGEICVGDRVFDEDGRVRYVTAKSQVWKNRKIYELEFGAGESIKADAEHLWSVTTSNDRANKKRPRVMTTEELFEWTERPVSGPHFSCGQAPVLDGVDMLLPVDPYILGYWLGDGTVGNGCFAIHVDDFASFEKQCDAAGIDAKHNGDRMASTSGLKVLLRAAGVLDRKHIPAQYLRASRAQRLALLQGLMDADGSAGSGKDMASRFWNTSTDLIAGFEELVRSLGGSPRTRINTRPGDSGGQINGKTIIAKKTLYEVAFYLGEPAHRLPRKLEKQSIKRSNRVSGHNIRSIREAGRADTVCIEVDSPSHLFLAGRRMVPTHNSILRNAYRSWFFAKRIQEFEAIGVERNMAGLVAFRMPPGYFASDAKGTMKSTKDAYKLMSQKFRQGEHAGLVYPSSEDEKGKTGWEIETLQGASKTIMDTNPIITRLEGRIALSMLAEVALLGLQGNVGSWALADVKERMGMLALRSITAAFTDVMNRFAIPRLIGWNGWEKRLSPLWEFGDIDSVGIADLVPALSTGVQSGIITPEPEIEKYLRLRLGIPLGDDMSLGQLQDAVGEAEERDPGEDAAMAEGAGMEVVPIADERKESMSDAEAADFVGVPLNTIRRAIRNQRLPGNKIGRQYRILRSDLLAYMRNERAAA
jgi:excisionase family DNA binding protein